MKNQENIKKHRLSFDEASELFRLPENLILEEYDFGHSIDEDRIISIGPIVRGMIVAGEVIRLINARFASTS